MNDIGPFAPPGVPVECRFDRREVARLEWWVGQPGDPAVLLEEFCRGVGLAAGDLSVGAVGEHGASGLCGVALLVSGAAGASMVGGAVGRASPSPAVPDVVAIAYEHGHGVESGTAGGRLCVAGWVPSWQPDDHAAAIERVCEAIGRGEVYQVNIVGHHRSAYAGDPASAVAAVAGLADGGDYAGVMSGDGWAVVSGSPECFVEVADGRVVTRPIKGTRPATEVGGKELLASVKERAEHVMIVDLERNDVARVAVPGSVAVTDFFALRHWCGLWQAESTVSAQIADGVGLARLLRAMCPPGSVTGAPKLAALDQIARYEPVGRGPAMGAMGYFSAERLVLGLTIRTVAVEPDVLHVWAGGGITWRSDPADEVAEAAAKAGPVKASIKEATSTGFNL